MQVLAGLSDWEASKDTPGTDLLKQSMLSKRKSIYFVPGDPCPDPQDNIEHVQLICIGNGEWAGNGPWLFITMYQFWL